MKKFSVPLLIVLLFGIASGYFVWKTWFAIPPRLYPQEFKKAVWITSYTGSPAANFRKELFISGPVKEGWLKVSASDKFILYVNGQMVANETFPSINVSGVYDLGGRLLQGKNVIAIFVYRMRAEGLPVLAAEGNYRDFTGNETTFFTDRTWQVSDQDAYASYGAEIRPWYDIDFDDSHWKPAGETEDSETGFLETNPAVFLTAFNGKFIWHPDYPSSKIILKNEINLPSLPVREVWIRVLSSLPYTLSVNGYRLDEVTISNSTIDLLKVTPLIRNGRNVLTLDVSGDGKNHGIAVDSLIELKNGEIITLKSDTGWVTGVYSMYGFRDIGEVRNITWKPVIEVVSAGMDSFTPDLIKKRIIAPLNLPGGYYSYRTLRMGAVLLVNIILTLFIWAVLSMVRKQRFPGVSFPEHLCIVSYICLPSLLLLIISYLLTFDIRVEPSSVFSPYVIYFSWGIFIVLSLLSFINFRAGLINSGSLSLQPAWLVQRKDRVFFLILIIICFTGFLYRINGLGIRSLSHDEVAMVKFAETITEKGYPYKKLGELEKPLTTYEIVPYPIAASITLFGNSDTTVRFPAVLFGTASIFIIGLFGKELFSVWAGWFAASIYAFTPLSVGWSQDCYFPQQSQMLTMLTIFLLFRYLKNYYSKPFYAYLSAVSFIFTFLSWEVSGFSLPAIAIASFVYKGKDLGWLKKRQLWIAIGIVCAAVFLQTARRTYFQIPYIVVGTGISDVTYPIPFFLKPMYAPFFYVQNFLLQENHFILTLILLAGIFYLRRSHELRYLYAILLGVLLEITNFLPYYAPRYAYFMQTVFILIAASVTVFILSGLIARIKKFCLPLLNVIAWCTVSIVILIIFISSNSIFSKLYLLSYDPAQPSFHVRTGINDFDYREVGAFIKNYARHTDVIISVMSHTLEYYGDIKPDYYIQSYTDRQVFYDIGRKENPSPYYLDRYVGSPVIRNVEELKNVLNRNHRVWIAAANYNTFLQFDNKEVLDYIKLNSKPVFQGNNAMVFLWEQ